MQRKSRAAERAAKDQAAEQGARRQQEQAAEQEAAAATPADRAAPGKEKEGEELGDVIELLSDEVRAPGQRTQRAQLGASRCLEPPARLPAVVLCSKCAVPAVFLPAVLPAALLRRRPSLPAAHPRPPRASRTSASGWLKPGCASRRRRRAPPGERSRTRAALAGGARAEEELAVHAPLPPAPPPSVCVSQERAAARDQAVRGGVPPSARAGCGSACAARGHVLCCRHAALAVPP